MTAATSDQRLTLLHVVHVLVWEDRAHRCRVMGCPGWTGEYPADRLDVWGPDDPPGPAVDVTFLRKLRELR